MTVGGWKKQRRKPLHSMISTHKSPKNYGMVTSVDQFEKFVDRLLKANLPIGFDIETGYDGPDRAKAALHPEESFVVGFSFTNSTEWARYVPLRHDHAQNVDPSEIAPLLWKLLNSGLVVCHNVAFELSFMSFFFREYLPDNEEVISQAGLFNFLHDSMIMAYVEASEPSVGLKALTKSVYGHDQAEISSLFPEGLAKNKMDYIRFNALDLTPAVVEYACEDAVWTLALAEHFESYLEDSKEEGASNRNLIYKLDKAVVPVLVHIREVGTVFDWDGIEEKRVEAVEFSDLLKEEILDLIEDRIGKRVSVNFNSPKQVGELYYDTLGLPPVIDRKTGKPTTNAKALNVLAKKDEIVNKILRWKEMKKMIGSYLEKYPRDYRYAPDGRAHPSYNPVRVKSGRFATSDPNTQQLPSPMELETNVRMGSSGVVNRDKLRSVEALIERAATEGEREAAVAAKSRILSGDGVEERIFQCTFKEYIVAPDNHYILGFDYSQQEYRVLAGISGETSLTAAYADGFDAHTLAASRVYGVDIEDVTPEQRKGGKNFNFSILYGQGIPATATALNKSVEETQELLQQYFTALPNVSSWMGRTVDLAREVHYSETYFGRRIDLSHEMSSPDKWMREHGERLAVNSVIQGTAADLTRMAMVNVMKKIHKLGLQDKVFMFMNVHDSLEFYVHESIDPIYLVSELRPVVEKSLPGFPNFDTDWHYGSTLASVQEISRDSLPVESSLPFKVEVGEVLVLPASVEEPVMTFNSSSLSSVELVFDYEPDRNSWARWSEWLKAHPGDCVITYVLPQSSFAGSVTAEISLDSSDIALIFPGVQVRVPEKDLELVIEEI